MKQQLVILAAAFCLAGCAFQTEAQINARLARHVGQSETDLVREMGVPTRQFDTDGHRFVAYVTGQQEIISTGGGGWGGYGGGGFGGWGWGYGGWGGPGWGGWGGPGWGGGFGTSNVVSYACETTFEIIGGRVAGFQRHGDAC